jgi:hypothetical protein
MQAVVDPTEAAKFAASTARGTGGRPCGTRTEQNHPVGRIGPMPAHHEFHGL